MDLAHDRVKIPGGGDKPGFAPLTLQRRFAMPATTEMKDHVYKILELVGSSEKSIEDAIQNAIARASKTIRDMKWFEVVQTRGHIENGSVRHYQVTLRVGFTLEG
jgi:flavin-binding protein dodecin